MSNWLGVVSAAHVRRGVSLGIAQIAHGRRPPLARMQCGDWFAYYSPRENMGDSVALQQFTALGTVADDEIWQADEGSFQPWRRRVHYLPTSPVDLAAVQRQLELTQGANWGYQLRRGLVPLSTADTDVLVGRFTGRP